MIGVYTPDDLNNVLGMIDFTWQNGGVRSEAQAMALNGLKMKTQQMLNPQPAAPPPPLGGEKKKCGKCGGDCADCGNCGDKAKAQEKPKGPPKAELVERPVDEPKEVATAKG